MVIADSRQDCPSGRRRKTATVLTAVRTGRPDGHPCAASFSMQFRDHIFIVNAFCIAYAL